MDFLLTRRAAIREASLVFAFWATLVRYGYAIGVKQKEPSYQSSSGNNDFDRALIAELKNIINLFEVNPGFQFVSENNVYYTTETMIDGTEGTIILGMEMIGNILKKDNGGVSVAGICAHECGHIYQWKYDLTSRLQQNNTIRNIELHADLLSGFYLGKRRVSSLSILKTYSDQVYLFGDMQITNASHHGTPDQRSKCVEKGFAFAKDGVSLAEAAQSGITYVLGIK